MISVIWGGKLNTFWDLLLPIVAKYPEVQFKYERAKDAFNAVLGNEPEPFELDVNLEGNELSVKTVKGKVFGPQPYLAVKTNLDDIFMMNLILVLMVNHGIMFSVKI